MNTGELDLLKQQADVLGIEYHTNIGAEKLKARIQDRMRETADASVAATSGTKTAEDPKKARLKAIAEANKLVRIRLTCMNPAKKMWPGEYISVSNGVIGVIKKFIDFEADEGYHVPQAILNVLQERMFSQRYEKKLRNGRKMTRRRLVKEFAIEILPPLTVDELKVIAERQKRTLNEDDDE